MTEKERILAAMRKAGADLVAIETMTDLYETKAALLAAANRSMKALSLGFLSVALIASATIPSTPIVR